MMACIAFLGLTLSSCNRSSREVWEDTKTCKRYMGKGLRSLFGQHVDSREYASYYEQWDDREFVPLTDNEQNQQLALQDYTPLSKESPGDPGSPIPGITGFSSPMGKLASVFSKVHFETDKYAVQGTENLRALKTIADYLTKNPQTYIFVEGHADERGAAAYNLALGSRRANSVRTFLIQNGVNPDQLFTISYGKEHPLVAGKDAATWRENRRAQFKVYDRR
ncbi:MAG: Peptidoglycan-associated lipoprotein [Chlamydiales bacterium]|nr:Peptidoglycan-associated lipoprotein [Chlamydiales bacterium]